MENFKWYCQTYNPRFELNNFYGHDTPPRSLQTHVPSTCGQPSLPKRLLASSQKNSNYYSILFHRCSDYHKRTITAMHENAIEYYYTSKYIFSHQLKNSIQNINNFLLHTTKITHTFIILHYLITHLESI